MAHYGAQGHAHSPLRNPQQIRGDSPDPRDDVHALGVIWYQLLTGDLAMVSLPADWHEELEPLALSSDMLKLLGQCLAGKWERRLANAGVLAKELEALLQPASPPKQPPETTSGKDQRENSGKSPAEDPKIRGPEQSRPDFLGTQPGQERDDNGLNMKFCWCPAGQFTMGSPCTEPDRSDDENQVKVVLSRGFWLAKFPVTQDEWQRLMGKTPSYFSKTGAAKAKLQGMDTASFPVEQVSHNEATQLAQRFTEQERKAGRLPADWEYRLPTEAQWEYACRAGTITATAFGDTLDSTEANFDGNNPYNGAANGSYLESTTAVGSYAANTWGLCDMHGNVWEWCRDWYQGKLPGGTDPEVSSGASFRVVRGGSWGYRGQLCRSAYRDWLMPSNRNSYLGFRLAAVQSGC